jgi:hypothetical protein
MLIETDFSSEVLANLTASGGWDVAAGSADNLSEVSFNDGKAIASSGGDNRYVRTDGPGTVQQRVEASFTFSSTGAGIYTGVLARHVDASSYVLARVIHDRSSLAAQIIERLNGVSTILGTVPWSDALPASPNGAAIRLEVVGRRARLWYEQSPRPVTDRPPDLAVDLSKDYSTPGQCGIYTSGTGDMKFTRFAAQDIPAAVMPPPSVSYADCTALLYNLSPITAEASEVSPDAVEIEWEVYPADPEDYPEAYRDLTHASITRRTFWVRPGFAYDVRCRERFGDGHLGDWMDFQRVTATGTKDGVLTEVVPTVEFPDVVPDYVMPRHQNAKIAATVADTGRERVQGLWPVPRNSFELMFQNRTAEEAQFLIDFFEQMQGRKEAFAWTHPTTGHRYALRFDADDYSIRYDDQGDDGSISMLSFEVIEVYLGMVSQMLVDVEAGEEDVVDSDCLVDLLNDRAQAAQESAYSMTRSQPDGQPLSAAEFNELSRKIAYLAQNVYVSDYNNPDSWVDYQQVTLGSSARVTSRRLVDARSALQKMGYIRRDVMLTPHQFSKLTMTNPAYSEDIVDQAGKVRSVALDDGNIGQQRRRQLAAIGAR